MKFRLVGRYGQDKPHPLAVKEQFWRTCSRYKEWIEHYPEAYQEWRAKGRNHRAAMIGLTPGEEQEVAEDAWVLEVRSLAELAELVAAHSPVMIEQEKGYTPAYPLLTLDWEE